MDTAFDTFAELDAGYGTGGGSTQLARLKGRRCLVLGAGGFLGRALCRALDDAGAAVHAFCRTAPSQPSPGLTTTGAFEDADTLLSALHGQELVFHLVSSSLPDHGLPLWPVTTSTSPPAAAVAPKG